MRAAHEQLEATRRGGHDHRRWLLRHPAYAETARGELRRAPPCHRHQVRIRLRLLTTQKTIGRTDPKKRHERTTRVQTESRRSAQGLIRSCGPDSPRGQATEPRRKPQAPRPWASPRDQRARHTNALSPRGNSIPLDARRAPINRYRRRFRSCVHPKGAPRERRRGAHAAARPSPGRGRHEPRKPPRAHRPGYASSWLAVGFSLCRRGGRSSAGAWPQDSGRRDLSISAFPSQTSRVLRGFSDGSISESADEGWLPKVSSGTGARQNGAHGLPLTPPRWGETARGGVSVWLPPTGCITRINLRCRHPRGYERKVRHRQFGYPFGTGFALDR
jgi:hypothetical protein